MTQSDGRTEECSSLNRRQRDRRAGLRDVLSTLSRLVGARADPGMMRGAFEEAVRRSLRVRRVRLRDATSRWTRVSEPEAAESVTFEVPAASPKARGVLEARFDAGTGLGEWDIQLLGLAAHLGALVLEIERSRPAVRPEQTVSGSSERDGAAPLIGSTHVIHALRANIERVAATDFTVLIEGESGVGKELVARQIHDLSGRRDGPFVAINCAALVETLLEAELFGIEERTATGVRGRRGKFEHADGGTLFLDEVSDLSPSAQAKLLRAIQDLAVERVGGHGTHRVDIRIVAATNRSLRELVERRLFRADLFYRLGGMDVRVPSLRERRPDIRELAAYFLERHRHARRLRLSEAALLALTTYDWPGNVRELERMMERAVAMATSDVIEVDDLPPFVRRDYVEVLMPSLRQDETLRQWAARYVRLMLHRCHDNKRQAARVLGISYHTLNSYLRMPEAGAPVAGHPGLVEDDHTPPAADTPQTGLVEAPAALRDL